jgi:hypothetical protein
MKFMDINLSPEDEKELNEFLNEWKKKELEKMAKALEENKKEEIKKVEEVLVDYKKELEEEYIDKVNVIIESIKPQLRKQILTEMNETNPDMLVMEKIKELIHPLLNESGKAYTNEINLLKKELDAFKRKEELTEGAKKKEELLSNYTDKTKNLIGKLMGEGSAIEMAEKYYEIVDYLQNSQEEELVEDEEVKEESIVEEKKEEIEEKENLELFDEDFQPTVETSTEQELKEQTEAKEQKRKNNFRSRILEYANS